MENLYLQYVHNLKGSSFENLHTNARRAILALLKDNFNSLNELQKAIISESSAEVLNFISDNLDLKKSFKNIVFTTNSKSFVENVDFNDIHTIINFKNINSLKYINEHFSSVNKLLPSSGIFIGRAETYWLKKLRIYKKFGQKIGRIIWMMDFVFNRIIPKLRGLNHIYYYLTKGTYNSISQAELLGRLTYSGFSIVDYRIINGLFYFAVIKTKEPLVYKTHSYHPIIKLQRIGKDGKMIWVYKLRTMHPYSEFIQDFVLNKNGYNEKGKPAFDFRITGWGRFFRKLWIDEFPQIINVLLGEMKLVGIRPVSKIRFCQMPSDLQKERVKYKPGCIPPYVALNMPDDEGNIRAERIYLRDLKNHPYTTDLKYLVKAIYNIVTNKIRSS